MCFRTTIYNSCGHVQSSTIRRHAVPCARIFDLGSQTVPEKCAMCACGMYFAPRMSEGELVDPNVDYEELYGRLYGPRTVASSSEATPEVEGEAGAEVRSGDAEETMGEGDEEALEPFPDFLPEAEIAALYAEYMATGESGDGQAEGNGGSPVAPRFEHWEPDEIGSASDAAVDSEQVKNDFEAPGTPDAEQNKTDGDAHAMPELERFPPHGGLPMPLDNAEPSAKESGKFKTFLRSLKRFLNPRKIWVSPY